MRVETLTERTWAGSAALLFLTLPTVAVLSLAGPLRAQEPLPGRDTTGDRLAGEAEEAGRPATLLRQVRVYLDCPDIDCDFDYVREEIGFVDWVRERQVADVHVLVTSVRTGAGGERITLDFIGRGVFRDIQRRFTYTRSPTETDANAREEIARILALGLVPYVARTPAGRGLSVSFERDGEDQAVAGAEDPWNLWVFRVRVGGELEGESSENIYESEGSISATRVGEEWKLDFGISGEYSEERFTLDDGEEIVSASREADFDALVVNAMGPHWSVGGAASLSSSTFLNRDFLLLTGPAIEYSFFPYDESTRRQLTLLYSVRLGRYVYDEVTIFGQTEETLASHAFTAALDLEQPWGVMGIELETTQFLHDMSRYRVTLGGDIELQLVGGLGFNVFGSASRIRDQLYLPREDATDEEVLLRRRQLATNYEYSFGFGLSYTFGSIYSNVVNPRFDDL